MKKYIQLIKPGYLFANDLTALAGFLLAAKGHISFFLLASSMLGISLGIISANIFNNLIDRRIDGKMQRTSHRVLVTGTVSPRTALFLAIFSAVAAILVLFFFTNFLTLVIGAMGFIFYEVFYSIAKRKTSWSTIIGSVPGACALVAGYTTVTNSFDIGAIILFLILVFWQMPHFYAIAIYRLDEYKNAGIPVLSVAKGIFITKLHIFFYTIAFAISVFALFAAGLTGYIYVVVMGIVSFLWIVFAFFGFFTKQTDIWARKMFFASLVVNLLFSLLIAINFLLV